MDYNFHTHTYRCGHATGDPENYLLRAIDGGIKYMGFSDHATHKRADGFESGFRVKEADVADYFAEISALREKYKEKIEIKIGFEMECYPEIFETMLQNAISYGAEYLILGEHYIEEEGPSSEHTIRPTEDANVLRRYVECLVFGIKSGVFTYVAHPDVLNFTGDRDVYIDEMRKICIASREYNIPLEINFLGIRDGRNYPNDDFWEIAGEEKCPVTFGFDAHKEIHAYDGDSLAEAEEMVEKFGLNYIGKPEIVFIQNLKK